MIKVGHAELSKPENKAADALPERNPISDATLMGWMFAVTASQ
jgi:hypothetical protein